VNELPVLSPDTISDEELRHWPLNRLRELHLEMGKQCNVRCTMCYQTDFSPATKAAEIIWRERLLPAYPTAKVLTISGGEPTILPGTRELLKLVMEVHTHLKLNMVTNGVLFRGIWDEAFLKHGDYLNVSLNAIDPGLYAKIVQFGRQVDVIANIDRIVRLRNETKSPLKIRISAVILEETVHEMADFVQWGVDHGLDQVLLFTDHFGTIRKIEPAQVQRYIAAAFEVADRNPQIKLLHLDDFDWYYARLTGRSPVRPRTTRAADATPCPVAFDTLFVNPDGASKPCCKSWYLYGDLIESTLQEVWNSDAAFRFRKRMLDLNFRDCMVACDLNARPINPRIAQLRKAYWVAKRDPKTAMQKALRKLGLTNAQIDQPDPVPLASEQSPTAKPAAAPTTRN
jgi:MoaA/NifB/PqqE/SkfB family radical SAM enzyme